MRTRRLMSRPPSALIVGNGYVDLSVRSNTDVRQATIGLNYSIRQSRLKVKADPVVHQARLQLIADSLFQDQPQYFVPRGAAAVASAFLKHICYLAF